MFFHLCVSLFSISDSCRSTTALMIVCIALNLLMFSCDVVFKVSFFVRKLDAFPLSSRAYTAVEW